MESKILRYRFWSFTLPDFDVRAFDLRGFDLWASAVLDFIVPNFAVAVSLSIQSSMVPSNDLGRATCSSAWVPCQA